MLLSNTGGNMAGPNFLDSVGLESEVFYRSGKLNLIHEEGLIDGSFILHHLLASFLKKFGDRASVALILNKEPQANWISKSLRLGWNWHQFTRSGQLVVFDLNEHRVNSIGSGTEKNNETFYDSRRVLNLKLVVDTVLKTLEAEKSEEVPIKQRLVIVEDLNTLLYECCESEDYKYSWSSEKTALIALKHLRLDLENTCVITLGNSADEDIKRLMALVSSLANTEFEVHPLSSGASSDVTGKLKVHTKNCVPSISKSFYFKVEEKFVKVNPVL